MSSIRVLVGSVMGTAESVAESLEPVCSAHTTTTVCLEPTVDDLLADKQETLLFCTSNTGAGELPDTLQGIYQALSEQEIDLSERRYGLINLGSSAFITYGQAGRDLDEALKKKQATRIGEILTLDACSDQSPNEAAVEWANNWLRLL